MTVEQKAYLKEHINDRPRKDLAQKLGITYQALLRWVHVLGGEIDKSNRRNDELRRKVVDMYKTMSSGEIAEKLGCKYSSVASIVQRMHLHRESEEVRDRLRKKSNGNWRATHKRSIIDARIAKMNRKIKVDMMRVMQGDAPLTRRYYRTYPLKTQNSLNYLCCRYNYFMYPNLMDRKEPIAFYDKNTNRLPQEREQYYMDRYGIKFLQAEE